MNSLTLRQLRYFEAVARYGHFGHAAESIGVSQPALSLQIKELEGSLCLALFERSARRVKLTSFGADFVERVRDVLRAVDDLGDMARASQESFAGRLRMGVIPTIAPYLLPRLIPDLKAAFPEPDLHVRETMTHVLIRELVDGLLDTAVVALPVSEPTLRERALFSEHLVLVRP